MSDISPVRHLSSPTKRGFELCVSLVRHISSPTSHLSDTAQNITKFCVSIYNDNVFCVSDKKNRIYNEAQRGENRPFSLSIIISILREINFSSFISTTQIFGTREIKFYIIFIYFICSSLFTNF